MKDQANTKGSGRYPPDPFGRSSTRPRARGRGLLRAGNGDSERPIDRTAPHVEGENLLAEA
jgi:hypothetical protein